MSATRLAPPQAVARRMAGWRSHRDVVRDLLLGPGAVVMVVLLAWQELHRPASAFDFRYAYWSAGHRVALGLSPYAWTATQFRLGAAFVYPALSALVFAPLSVLSVGFGSALFTCVCIGLVPLTLWMIGVRDWRVFGVTLIWTPVYDGWMTANESLFLMVGLACLWRWRGRPFLAGLATAVLISLKPMMWPLLLWLLVTRRWRASVTTLVSGLLLNLAAWSVIGLGQIGAFVQASRIDTDAQWRRGYGIPALLGHLGAGRTAGIAAIVVLSVMTLFVTAVGRNGLAKRNEIQALTLAVVLALLASPIVWSHYLVLLIVPLAVLRPRFDWVWGLPLVMWVCPPAFAVHTWQAIIFWLAVSTMCAALVTQSGRLRAREQC